MKRKYEFITPDKEDQQPRNKITKVQKVIDAKPSEMPTEFVRPVSLDLAEEECKSPEQGEKNVQTPSAPIKAPQSNERIPVASLDLNDQEPIEASNPFATPPRSHASIPTPNTPEGRVNPYAIVDRYQNYDPSENDSWTSQDEDLAGLIQDLYFGNWNPFLTSFASHEGLSVNLLLHLVGL